MAKTRNTYKYHLKEGNKIVHRGITYDLNRREVEHQEKFPGTYIEQVGHRTTRTSALKWERTSSKNYLKLIRKLWT